MKYAQKVQLMKRSISRRDKSVVLFNKVDATNLFYATGEVNRKEAERFVKEYCGNNFDDKLRFHYLAYTAIVSYYWYVWALYREACGAVMGESLYNWHVMAKRYSRYLVKEFGL